jgi:hypothetical protein
MSVLPISRELGKALRASAIRFKTADLSVLYIIEDEMNEDIAYRGDDRAANDSCKSASFVAALTLDY